MKPLEEQYPKNVVIFKMDVSSLDSIQEGYQFVKDQLSKFQSTDSLKLDLLYNNAGQPCTFPAIDVPDQALLDTLNVNVTAPIRVTKIFGPLVINAKGTIAFTGSVAALTPLPWCSVYSASKAALAAYCSTLAFELEPFDVKVVHVTTGAVVTAFSDARPIPEDSLYLSTKEGVECFEHRKKMLTNLSGTAADKYCRSVVNKIEKISGSTFNIYEGSMSWVAPIANKVLPRFILLAAFKAKFKLDALWDSLRRKYSNENKKQT
ncbi:unnamed protein product [Ambrosiozyma monospora]|uniref:Unnamed protein product n=1 Tax=Ambrosiozyma monospora TaxID=43982 RepID=A0ACB5U7K2_AMBMO|nr:unnamed protein product [Ambrosiozyma monospora]